MYKIIIKEKLKDSMDKVVTLRELLLKIIDYAGKKLNTQFTIKVEKECDHVFCAVDNDGLIDLNKNLDDINDIHVRCLLCGKLNKLCIDLEDSKRTLKNL